MKLKQTMYPKKIAILVLLSLILNIITSCRKGEDDPFLSIYSREKRIIGEWKVSEGEVRCKNPPNNAYYEKYNNNKIFLYTSDDYYNYIAEGLYYWYFSIKKDGKYSISKTINLHNYKTLTFIEEGTWYFLFNDDGYKNKERVAFQPTKYIYNNVVSYDIKKGNPNIYSIKELRNKKIVIEKIHNNKNTHPIYGQTAYWDEMITMIPKD